MIKARKILTWGCNQYEEIVKEVEVQIRNKLILESNSINSQLRRNLKNEGYFCQGCNFNI